MRSGQARDEGDSWRNGHAQDYTTVVYSTTLYFLQTLLDLSSQSPGLVTCDRNDDLILFRRWSQDLSQGRSNVKKGRGT
jgi:hypothetical protein